MRGEVVTVLSARTVHDDYSNADVPDWSDPAERDVMTLAPAEPRPAYLTDEPTQDARNSIVAGFTLYLPANDPITRLDRVRVRGEAYPVRGVPARWGNRGLVVQVFSEEG